VVAEVAKALRYRQNRLTVHNAPVSGDFPHDELQGGQHPSPSARMAKIISAPQDIVVVSAGLLKDIVLEVPGDVSGEYRRKHTIRILY
jgi:hypothetical protein